MKRELTTHECAKALMDDQWSRGGAFAMVEYLEQCHQTKKYIMLVQTQIQIT